MGRSGPERRRRAVLPVLAAVLLAGGCAASPSSAAPATTTTATTSVDPSAAAAAQYDSDRPPATAEMVCSDEIRSGVAEILGLASSPTPQSGWADHVYTCTYALPMGTLVLSVTVARSDADARTRLDALRAQLGAVDAEDGLGAQAYSAPNGTVLAVKDNMVLDVDATALPDDLGPGHRSRLQVARLLAAGVFACWTGES